jgi:fluoride ion exporter CrcB/FEX
MGERAGSIARRRVQIGVFGAETYFSTLSTENVEMGPYPQRVSLLFYSGMGAGGSLKTSHAGV